MDIVGWIISGIGAVLSALGLRTKGAGQAQSARTGDASPVSQTQVQGGVSGTVVSAPGGTVNVGDSGLDKAVTERVLQHEGRLTKLEGQDRVTEEGHGWFRERHLDRLREIVDQLRACAFDMRRYPIINDRILVGPNGFDWGLIPEHWAEATTPDLCEPDDETSVVLGDVATEVWGDMWPALKQHLGETGLWNNIRQLRQMARELDAEQRDAAERVIGELDRDVRRAYRSGHSWIEARKSPLSDWDDLRGFYDVAAGRMKRTRTPVADGWKELQAQAAMVRIHRIPESPKPDWDLLPIAWNEDFFNGISSRLRRVIPDIDKRRLNLVKKLWEINEALSEDAVERTLIAGTCDQCRDMG